MRWFVKDNVHAFYRPQFEIEVSVGEAFATMRLPVVEFKPKISYCGGVPLALAKLAPENTHIHIVCTQYIEAMYRSPSYAASVSAADATPLARTVLQSVLNFCTSTTGAGEDLLQATLMLHASLYYMSTIVTFNPASIARLNPLFGEAPFSSSRVLNRQLKSIMNSISKELANFVLSGLERTLRSRDKSAWGATFCAVLVLSLYMEYVQMASDMFFVFGRRMTGSTFKYTRDQSLDDRKQIDDLLAKLAGLFHEAWKSSSSRKTSLNPMRAHLEGADNILNLDHATISIVQSMCSIVESK